MEVAGHPPLHLHLPLVEAAAAPVSVRMQEGESYCLRTERNVWGGELSLFPEGLGSRQPVWKLLAIPCARLLVHQVSFSPVPRFCVSSLATSILRFQSCEEGSVKAMCSWLGQAPWGAKPLRFWLPAKGALGHSDCPTLRSCAGTFVCRGGRDVGLGIGRMAFASP